MPNWQDSDDYVFIEKYRPELVAWEFLRRNPEYQQDYHYFITVWNELEQKYGSPPKRDFEAWKKDPRAYRAEREIYQLNENASEVCASPDDNLLIECWMGAKWGFYKFPISPEKDNPIIGEELTWRTVPINVRLINNDNISEIKTTNLENKTAIVFDLNKDLKEQLQSAKQQLILAQRQNTHSQQQTQTRILYLRIIDALHSNVNDYDIQIQLAVEQNEFLNHKQSAYQLLHGGYLELLNQAVS